MFWLSPSCFWSRKHHALIRGRSRSIDDNTHIPEDRPRGPCILVSLTSLMSSLDHLRGVRSASRDDCFSHAWLQLHHRTVEIHTGYWSVQYLVEDPGCHLTLAYWWVYSSDLNRLCPLWFSGCVRDSGQKPQQCFDIPLWLMQHTCTTETLTLNQWVHTAMYHSISSRPLVIKI